MDATESGTSAVSVTSTSTESSVSMSNTSVNPSGEDSSTTIGPPMDVGPMCGDGQVNQDIEACDGMDLPETSCAALGYTTGELSCTDDCTFDVSECDGAPNPCGNGMLEDREQCDGTLFGKNTCEALKGENLSGTPYCSEACAIDYSTCCRPAKTECVALLPDTYECCPGLSCNALAGNLGMCE